MTNTVKAAILGSGNIGTDLMYKILKNDGYLEVALVAGIDPESEGLRRAKEKGIAITVNGVEDILKDEEIQIVFDATSAKAHMHHAEVLGKAGKMVIDLTPAAVGPYLVPPVNIDKHQDAKNVNMISCAGQATTPLVYAVSRVAPVEYAEMIATVASKAIGPGTRQNVDEFTMTTANALVAVGGAKKARAIPVFNPAEPPVTMSNTVYAVLKSKEYDEEAIKKSIFSMVEEVNKYIPGYRLKGDPTIEMRDTPWGHLPVVITINEVEGEGDFFPTYAGNLDIMTASARRVGELYAKQLLEVKEGQL